VPGDAKGKLCGPLKQIASLLVVPIWDLGKPREAEGWREKATQDAAALTSTAKMIPLMIQTMDKFHAMSASPEHIVRFLQATIDEINSGLRGRLELGKRSPHAERIIYRGPRWSTTIAPEEIVTPLTSAQCLAIAERKIGQAIGAAGMAKSSKRRLALGWFSPRGLKRASGLKRVSSRRNRPAPGPSVFTTLRQNR
jgi:hypothetical protein